MVLIDGARQDAMLCRDNIRKLATQQEFRQEFQVSGLSRWFAIVTNCSGLIDDVELDLVPKDADSTVGGYDAVRCFDENKLLNKIPVLTEIFSS